MHIALLSAGQPFFQGESEFYEWMMTIGGKIIFYWEIKIVPVEYSRWLQETLMSWNIKDSGEFAGNSNLQWSFKAAKYGQYSLTLSILFFVVVVCLFFFTLLYTNWNTEQILWSDWRWNQNLNIRKAKGTREKSRWQLKICPKLQFFESLADFFRLDRGLWR